MSSAKATLKDYYRLTKPGIIYGNALHIVAGYMLAARGHINIVSLISVVFGGGLIIACGCVLNNDLDRGIDKNMTRTKERALVTGKIQPVTARWYAAGLGSLGALILAFGTNPTTLALGVFGLFAYVVIYGWAKRTTAFSTIIGSISGSIPLVAGYTAVTGHVDFGAVLLFLILASWQIPHFYAIAIYRFKDYKRAGLPVWPVVHGITSTKIQIAAFIFTFTALSAALSLFGFTGFIYFILMGGLGMAWFYKALQGFGRHDDGAWARGIFGFSLIISIAMLVLFTFGPLLP